ncbi:MULTISPECIES: phosphoadenylyl-sulfate reductase [Burkholderiaceae]|uniref:phosphoadenylyl-sulfate reductase n=1 Tax=Burkholderiaceae TaxID=119060 RepID=UPI0009694295|nr:MULTISPECIES: phosphoadenylyl-sulfate reductase [Burkholderiaceae]MCG1038479.1 phosphoadenylyl-sulfate reductase [Mycetohabitans sp. B7]SIT79980.1 phosphoadenylylsulfate reductase (thioredoxin) [Burkholderia sp. b14]
MSETVVTFGRAAPRDPLVHAEPLTPQRKQRIEKLDALLATIAASHTCVKFASSLAAEDMLLTHAILSRKRSIIIFSLNTGRLHAETVGMIEQVRQRYGYVIEQWHPQQDAVDAYVSEHGLNAFYDSIELRKRCCEIRKVEPLNRALAGAQAWMTGQRREQSVTRAQLPEREQDGARGIAKYNPLADWTEADVWAYLKAYDVPVNPLHARGYPSIGCEPCTRAIRVGEDSRAGRWWWESRDSKECGLHPGAPAQS